MTQIIQFEITCRQVWKEISNFLENEVTPELRVRIERHLANCNHCSAIMDGTRNTLTLVADRRAFDLPPETSQRLYSRLAEFISRKD